MLIFQPALLKIGPKKHFSTPLVSEKKAGLRCPISGVEVNWDRFCYFVEEKATSFPVDGE